MSDAPREEEQVTVNILDIDHWSAGGAVAVLDRHWKTERFSFKLSETQPVKALSAGARGKYANMVPNLLAVSYSKMNDEPWKITGLRVYGQMEKDPEQGTVNIYPHEELWSEERSKHSRIPAWIREAALKATPK